MILSAGELNSETIYSVTGRGKEEERRVGRWERGYWVLYKEEKKIILICTIVRR